MSVRPFRRVRPACRLRVAAPLTLVLLAGILAPAFPVHAQAEAAPEDGWPSHVQTVPFPASYEEVAATWLAEAEALGKTYENREWFPNASVPLDYARAALENGRVTSVGIHLANHEALVEFFLLEEEVGRLTSHSAKRTRVLAVTDAILQEAKTARDAFRTEVKTFENESLSSLLAFEGALYASLRVLEAESVLSSYEVIRRAFLEEGYDESFMYTLVTHAALARWFAEHGEDLLAIGMAKEGTAPLLKKDSLSAYAFNLTKPPQGNQPPSVKRQYALLGEAHRSGERVFGLATWLSIERILRAQDISAMFGQAANRGLDAQGQLLSNLNRSLDNASAEAFTSRGYTSLIPADATDRGLYARENQANGLGFLAQGWGAMDLERTGFVGLFKVLSPVEPPEVTPEGSPAGNNIPGPGAIQVAATLVASAVLAAGGRLRGKRG